ncbi:hypothetical protein BT93_E1242 [Corymbia citriodora subsp. variegata]|nr:hypothetical protein BT93_E1242 [Corymbia citriodora subsp. variegata]
MSFNQPRYQKSEAAGQDRRAGRSASFSQQRNSSGGYSKGGGAPAPSPSLSANRSFNKKSNNVQGGQSRVNNVRPPPNVSSEPAGAAPAQHNLQNGAHVQPQPLSQGQSDAGHTSATAKLAETPPAPNRSTRAVPKAPASQPPTVSSGVPPPSTPQKASGDASKGFSFQFGTLSPGLMNGMQIPARTSSAPPNLDEQKRDQARHEAIKTGPPVPVPPAPKHPTKRDLGAAEHSNAGDSHTVSKGKKDQVPPIPPSVQSQKPSSHAIPGISMQMPFNQPQVPIQFSGPNTSIQSQGMASASLQMSIPMPMLNAPPMQQQMFVPGLQPHMMQPQGIMHQGQGLSFAPQLNSQFSPPLGSLGMGISPYSQQQGAKFGGGPRKTPVKITHPETHQEVRLDKRTEGFSDGVPTSRSHPNVSPQAPHISSYQSNHPVNYYTNSYSPSPPLFFPAPSSLPLSGTQITPTSQAPRFNPPVNQGAQRMTLMNSQDNLQLPERTNISIRAVEPPKQDQMQNSHAPPSLAQGTSKPRIGSDGENFTELSSASLLPAFDKVESPKAVNISGNSTSRNSEVPRGPLSKEPGSELGALPGPNKQYVGSTGASGEWSATGSSTANRSSTEAAPTNVAGRSLENLSRSNSTKNHDQGKKGDDPHPIKVDEEGNSVSAVALWESSHGGVPENLEAKTTNTSPSEICEDVPESLSESLSTTDALSPDNLELKHDGVGEGIVSVSSEISAGVLDPDNSQGSQQSIQDDSAKKNEILDNTDADRGELESMGPVEQSKESDDSSVVSCVSGSLEHSGIIREGDQDSVPLVEASGKEVLTSITERTSLDEERYDLDIDKTMGNSEVPTSSSVDSKTGEATPCDAAVPLASVHGDNSYADASLNGMDEVIDSSSVSMSDSFKAVVGDDGDVTESVGGSSKSVQIAGPKDKPAPEISRFSSNMARGKKKRKELLQKADAAGPTDLYNAYKGSEERNEALTSSRDTQNSSEDIHANPVAAETSPKEAVVSDDVEQIKPEIDDWEDVVDVSSPALESPTSGHQVDVSVPSSENRNGSVARKYSRDFLLKFAERCTNLPENFEVTHDIAEAFNPSVNVSRFVDRDSHPSPVRMIDRQSGGARLDRRGSGLVDDDKWSKLPGNFGGPGRDLRLDVGLGANLGLRSGQGGNYGVLRNPRGQTPVQYAGGILSGPMQSPGFQGGMQRNNSDADRWQRASGFQQKGLIPSPQTPLQMMHRAERKYEVGKVTDEEQAKQRQLKAILNKLTPQNFEKLFEQVKAVDIDNATTLRGLISQIFDKALMEPTFCEMYANLCSHLAQELPDFVEDNNKITFKRVLLNKCQEEFERGEREEQEANKAEEEGEIKQSEEEREEKRIKARRRMLGNIRLIGELYKKRMLTEKIMHECIKKLLGQQETPEEEDIEALCKLMSTIGEMIDHPRAKHHMDAYFDRMWTLSNNMNLSSRVRFMLKDSSDLRKNKWQQRRKVEGPKKIDEVHRDAAQERHAQVSRNSRGSGINPSRRGQPVDFSSRGSSMLSSPNAQVSSFRGSHSQVRGQGSQDVRFEERQPHEPRPLAVPLPQRLGDDSHSITLGPQGGLGRGMSFRGLSSGSSTSVADISSNLVDSRRIADNSNGFSSAERTSYSSKESATSHMADRLSGSGAYDQSGVHRNRPGSREGGGNSPLPRVQGTNVTQDISSEKIWPEDRLRDKSITTIKEFYSAKDEKEVSLCIKELNSPSFYPSMICLWVTDSFERKDSERDLLAKLLITLSKPQECILRKVDLIKGFESVLTTLEDALNDAPKAAEYVGRIFGKVIVEEVITLGEIGHLIREGGEEPGQLLQAGYAADVLGSTLEVIKSEKGESVFNEIRSSSNLQLEDFRPPAPRSSRILDKFF